MKNKKIILILIVVILIVSIVIGIKKEKSHNEITNLGNDLCVTEIGKYSGKYVEDGSDLEVTDVLMMQVENRGKEPIEYAVIKAYIGEEEADFTVSALLPGEEAILLEKKKMKYDPAFDYKTAVIGCTNIARFQNELTLHKDKIEIQMLDGAMNVTNISKEDIKGNVAIYYKNKKDDIYLGGIAYRVVLEGGIKTGEIRQQMAKHISENDSEVLFVTII